MYSILHGSGPMGTISPQLEVRMSLLYLVFEADYFAVSVTSSNRIPGRGKPPLQVTLNHSQHLLFKWIIRLLYTTAQHDQPHNNTLDWELHTTAVFCLPTWNCVLSIHYFSHVTKCLSLTPLFQFLVCIWESLGMSPVILSPCGYFN